MTNVAATDGIYRELLLEAIRECRTYRPKFGGDDGVEFSVSEFRRLYGADPLYHWVGLDSDLMYAAHKAAGGMTSVYRQLGIGCERLLRQVIRDTLHLDADEVAWSYEYEKEGGGSGVHALDARIDVDDVSDPTSRARIAAWVAAAATGLGLPAGRASALRGAVLEVRQGYKSADSKRQNADLRFCTRAYNENYLPVLAVVSTQVSAPVVRRYRSAQLLVLLGLQSGSSTESTFSFFERVVGYDLGDFFRRNSDRLRTEFTEVLTALLRP